MNEEFEFEFEDEAEDMELAAELLTLQSEEELDYFLGKFLKKAWTGIKKAASSPIGKALIGGLKKVAKTALPLVGKVAGNFLVPGVGGVVGGMLGNAASKLIPELETMSEEQAQLEVAQKVVALAKAAAHHAANAPAGAPPEAAARDALVKAAQQVAPALVPSLRGGGLAARQAGRWWRQGRTIVLEIE
jgi:hypothetical protein